MMNRQPWLRSLFTISHLRSGLHSKQQILLGVLISLMKITMNMVPAYRSFPRYHMCTVAAAAPDKTSWNIYVFGGQNDTFTPGDIWALSFPR